MEQSAADLVAFGASVMLGFAVIPVWMAMGVADYFCHRATDIAHTSGLRESLMHMGQFVLVGMPLVAALFFRVNAGLLMLMLGFLIAHHALAYIDVRYANAARMVWPVEQMVHSFLELMPITAFLLISTLSFGQVEALFGVGVERAEFAIRLRDPPLPGWYVAAVLACAFFFNLLPYLEELVRCVRARRARESIR